MAEATTPSVTIRSEKRAHAVCLPYPAQGHITPFLQLAKLLHYIHGFHITYVNTEYNHRRLLRSQGVAVLASVPGFDFLSIPDGLPPSDDIDATQDIPSLCNSTSKTCLAPFRSLLEHLNSSTSATPPVTCIIIDNFMTFALDAAAELNLPAVVFGTTSACGFMGYLHYQHLVDCGIFPLKQEDDLSNGYLDTKIETVAGMNNMRLRDFPSFVRTTNANDFMFNFDSREAQRTKLASAVVFNTFEELEHGVLDAMGKILPPIYPIGPLVLFSEQIPPESPLKSLGSNLWREDRECLEWLRGRQPQSVVYVNFGSITVMRNNELLEFAWGLANSGFDFLWIVRSDLVEGDTAVLPPEFTEETKTRSLLASWCAQDQVLADPAVGVFLTHSGWNSTLESIGHGVPMISWPFFAEQPTNCRYACVEWGVAMEIDNNVTREAVAKLITEAMGGKNGKEMRRRAAEWKEKALRAAQSSGAAATNLERLVNDVLISEK